MGRSTVTRRNRGRPSRNKKNKMNNEIRAFTISEVKLPAIFAVNASRLETIFSACAASAACKISDRDRHVAAENADESFSDTRKVASECVRCATRATQGAVDIPQPGGNGAAESDRSRCNERRDDCR